MFISKRWIKGKNYYYLEDRVAGKRLGISLGAKISAEQVGEAFDELLRRNTLELARKTDKQYSKTSLSFNEILALERLKTEYKIIAEFFPEGQKSFEENEFVRYAQGSASVEGNSLSLQQATIVLTKGAAIAGKKIEEIKEIENMKRALETRKKIRTINEKSLKKIHSAIMFSFSEKKPGRYRKEPIFIQGSEVKTAKPEQIENEMKKLFDWLEKNGKIKHPIELAAEFHARFEEIHPFLDGNGRTGREILNYMLMQAGYPRAIINLENRESYIALLERVQLSKEYGKFTKFIFFCLETRAKEIEQTINENKKAITNQLISKNKQAHTKQLM